jgi:hypothetical protein
MTAKTTSVSLGRARLPQGLAGQLNALPPGLRGRVVAFVLLAHVQGLNLPQLVAASTELRRLGVLVNQSLRASAGRSVDVVALQEAAKKVNQLWP